MENRSPVSDIDNNHTMPKHHPLDKNREAVNQHYEDTLNISLDNVQQSTDIPTKTGEEDPYWTEGLKNPGWWLVEYLCFISGDILNFRHPFLLGCLSAISS